MKECPLCTILHKQIFRVIEENDGAYSFVPFEPQYEGHILVLPKRHAKLTELTAKELVAVRDLAVKLKNRLVELYPEAHPVIYTVTDTMHASIPQHFHYHIQPTKDDLRKVFASHYPGISIKKRASDAELERMANLIKGDPLAEKHGKDVSSSGDS